MNNELRQLLEGVKSGEVSIDDAVLKIKRQPFDDLGFAKVDLHRKYRQGTAEVIFGSGKTAEQLWRRNTGSLFSDRSLLSRASAKAATQESPQHSATARTAKPSWTLPGPSPEWYKAQPTLNQNVAR